jgi:tRNA threonylcarbamoyladenosine biosynthesis protein TsaB
MKDVTTGALLALETSAAACSAAVWRNGGIAAARFRVLEHGHAEALLPMAQEVMAATGLTYRGLDLVAVCVGPGSFTGVRVGVATARAMALAAGLPAVGISAFEAVAAAVPSAAAAGRTLVVALDSRRRDLFVQCFAGQAGVPSPACAVAPEALADRLPPGPVLIAGNAADRAAAALDRRRHDVVRLAAAVGPDAQGVAAVAAAWNGVPRPPRPLYLRAPDARVPDARP